MTTQLSIPLSVRPEEVARKATLGGAIDLCMEIAQIPNDKSLQYALGVDKAQFSRWQSGAEGIMWDKFAKLMDVCGNDAPLFWMVHQRGYDVSAMRRIETGVERENRLLREQLAEARHDKEVLIQALRGVAA